MVFGHTRYRFEEVESGGRPLAAVLRYAIGRSRARHLVLQALAAHSPQYASELARSTRLTVTNVVGAIVGGGERYAEDLCLAHLGLVAEVPRQGSRLRVFWITPLGIEVVKGIGRDGSPTDSLRGPGSPVARS